MIVGLPLFLIIALAIKLAGQRRSWRSQHAKPMRVRASAPGYDEEIGTTVNASRDGLYFATLSRRYSVGMPLMVTFLYESFHPCSLEYPAEVVRVDRLSDGRLGIAVSLLTN